MDRLINRESELDSKRFAWKRLNAPNRERVRTLHTKFPRLHPVLADLLIARGLNTGDEIGVYFSTDIGALQGGIKMKDLEKAADRLIVALQENQKIRLYGDYDVDGTTSVAMMSLFLENLDADFGHYIPDRYGEGYGVSDRGIDDAITQKVNLFITLDCGIRAVDKVERLKESGIDTIICDHHEAGEKAPPAFAILNHKQKDCPYEEKILCGCGVALALIKEVVEKLEIADFDFDRFYELAAIATCSDIVPLRGVNRAIVAKGLEVISRNPGYGVSALLGNAGHKGGAVQVSDIVFKIAPRINAAGRMDHADIGVKLLLAHSEEEASDLAEKIEKLNISRKERDIIITEEALELMLSEDQKLENSSTIVAKKSWHKGLVGIVASRLMETCYRPTIVLTENDGWLSGSARSTPSFNLHEALTACSEHLEKYGGHAAAAGLTLKKENLDRFKSDFEAYAKKVLGSERKYPSIEIALEVNFEDWHNEDYQDFYTQLNRFRPFGPENLPPVFATAHCRARNLKVLGGKHLKFTVHQDGKDERELPVIAFGFAEKFDHLASGGAFELAYSIEENVWKNRRTLQLVAKDIKS
ncbi:MAG: single-stranded-DNA-specific exonuclease [Cryomorphaceae bacterium]|jgi:single-stranded-DNA-specific exonuclease